MQPHNWQIEDNETCKRAQLRTIVILIESLKHVSVDGVVRKHKNI